MKKAILALFVLLSIQITFAQNATIAKFKFEEAEQAYVNEDYKTVLNKLEESEKLFGKVNPPILYLRIMAQNNLLGTNPHDDPALLLALHKNCKFYLKEYANINEVEDKYREVYQVSDYIKIYSDNQEFFKARSLYYGTQDTPQDLTKAFELCAKLTQTGDHHAMNLMGLMYMNGKSVEKDKKKGMEWYQRAADKGNVFALTNLASDYYRGENVEQDYNKALQLYQEAANKGFPDALYQTGSMYYYGDGVSIDYDKAFIYLQKAATKKHVGAISRLGYMYDTGKGVAKNKIIATELYQKGANLGNSYAMVNLAINYYYGAEGLTQNYKEALSWYLKAAENGSINSKRIGDMYNGGQGTEKDHKEAYKWYLLAAEKGDSDAMVQIGVLFGQGLIPTDMSTEITNSTQTVGSEQKNAETRLIGTVLGGLTNFNGPDSLETPYPKNFTESMRWFLMAAEKNNGTAMRHIATYYTYGFGVKKDKKLGKEWVNKAIIAESQKK